MHRYQVDRHGNRADHSLSPMGHAQQAKPQHAGGYSHTTLATAKSTRQHSRPMMLMRFCAVAPNNTPHCGRCCLATTANAGTSLSTSLSAVYHAQSLRKCRQHRTNRVQASGFCPAKTWNHCSQAERTCFHVCIPHNTLPGTLLHADPQPACCSRAPGTHCVAEQHVSDS